MNWPLIMSVMPSNLYAILPHICMAGMSHGLVIQSFSVPKASPDRILVTSGVLRMGLSLVMAMVSGAVEFSWNTASWRARVRSLFTCARYVASRCECIFASSASVTFCFTASAKSVPSPSLRFLRRLRVMPVITSAVSNASETSVYVAMSSEIFAPAFFVAFSASLAFAAWKMPQIAFPPVTAHGHPSASASLITACLKVG